jgi:DNA-binding XRE family transcriptional regulator
MSTGKRYKIRMQTLIDIDISPIATFKWNETNGLKLRERRENAGYSRKSLSEATGLSQTYIQQLETPQHFLNKPKKPKEMTVSTETLVKICAVIGGDVISLFWDIEI